jgi:Spy/CpxP family protein refolding chaperone
MTTKMLLTLSGRRSTLLTLGLMVLLGSATAIAQLKGSGSGSGSGSSSGVGGHNRSSSSSAVTTGLTDREMADLRAGRELGLALAADLNGYPGPAHVLEYADLLKLTDDQRREVQTIFDWTTAQAETLGRSYIEAEQTLANLFRERKVDKQRLVEPISAVEKVRSELRLVHLSAHLEIAALLTETQRDVYDALRGQARAKQVRLGRGSGSGSGSGVSGASACRMPASTSECCCSSGSSCQSGSGMSCGPGRGNN